MGFPLIYLSIKDFMRMLQRGALLILLVSMLSGCFALVYMLFRPLHFTAEGIFKGTLLKVSISFLKPWSF